MLAAEDWIVKLVDVPKAFELAVVRMLSMIGRTSTALELLDPAALDCMTDAVIHGFEAAACTTVEFPAILMFPEVTITEELPDVMMTLELPEVTITLELPDAITTVEFPAIVTVLEADQKDFEFVRCRQEVSVPLEASDDGAALT